MKKYLLKKYAAKSAMTLLNQNIATISRSDAAERYLLMAEQIISGTGGE